jgi:nucleoside-diphosphate-sugar epimerase
VHKMEAYVIKILIAGGAGYIGSTIASACLDAGIVPIILYSLVTGSRQFVDGREFYEGDIADGPLIDRIFSEHSNIDAVIHCAAHPLLCTTPCGDRATPWARTLVATARNGSWTGSRSTRSQKVYFIL